MPETSAVPIPQANSRRINIYIPEEPVNTCSCTICTVLAAMYSNIYALKDKTILARRDHSDVKMCL